MNLARFLSEDRVDLDIDRHFDEERPVDTESLADLMADLLIRSEDVVNANKLRLDLLRRERQAPALLGHGVALPHVRTLQARKLILAIGISRSGLELDTPDDMPVRLVIALVGPPYNDKQYLTAYKRLGEDLSTEGWVTQLLAAEKPGEVMRSLSR